MEDEIIIKSIEHQETQILSMRRELKGIHASITDIEVRANKTRLLMIGAGVVLIFVAVWLLLS